MAVVSGIPQFKVFEYGCKVASPINEVLGNQIGKQA